MPSLALATLLPLALVSTTALAAPHRSAPPAVVRLVGRAPTSSDLTLDQLHERRLDSFARLANVVKRGVKVPSSTQKRGGAVIVPLELDYDQYNALDAHAAEVSIGGQILPVLFDTGSPDLVVPVDCKSGCANGFLNTTASPTFVSQGGDVSVAYGTGSATGYIADDTVRVAGLTVKKQVFAAATELSTAGGENWSAIFGLAPGGGAYTGGPSFIQRLIQQGSLAGPIFSMSLKSPKPEIVFGGIDRSQLGAAPVTVQNFGAPSGIWLAGIGSTTVDKNVVDGSVSYALVDSGSTFSAMPRSAAAAVYAATNGTLWKTQRMAVSGIEADVDIYTVPCEPSADVGRVGFNFLGSSRPEPVSMSAQSNVLEYADDEASDRCYGALYGADVELAPGSGMNGALLGMPFLKSVLAVFEFDDSANGVKMAFSGVKVPRQA
ncbi:hypothetical protein JCM9279_007512 [Rhodotorula babjevae]